MFMLQVIFISIHMKFVGSAVFSQMQRFPTYTVFVNNDVKFSSLTSETGNSVTV
jgi:hypothetical protein